MRSLLVTIGMMVVLQGCAVREPMSADQETPTLTPRTSTYQDLLDLPRPRGPLVAAVYGFRDQTGQYKPSPASSFSTAVTQGAASMLVDAMQASGWFIVLEREGLQNVLTERKIIRASQAKPDVAPNIQSELPSLLAANIIMEGAIVAYETNVRSGGQGARYLGIGVSQEYRVDQVTVNLRAIDVRSGQVLSNVMTTKTIYSIGRSANVYKFIEFKELLEAEAGYTTNEPAQLCVLSAIEAAVAHLIAQGVDRRLWQTAENTPAAQAELAKYLTTRTKL
ncbi:curli production assembly/transport protein CsgG [Stutzerimonas zhaodongensis]|uniref:Curli production assembly/transport component CsgG n=1 Tax=Stutzerimonas zhaodongensis TaxID=1176257 RepID=A0A3M2HKC8_9GAMM|nr:CsgG/HfaB family protein [Stutzerimonas zhaodongensis]MCQ2028737.1 curli production assembly/transport protein CsgG [Stutzerimonas zhaodongensis]MCQ4315294.1 curli production assembly/transport protein CsgG [Stutzerimonas zhaodongensis]RMH90141.1 curli production assembly/transport protein CsgG [Stutzerimonas zhaodongensis]